MARKDKYNKIKYFLSNGKIITYANSREKAMAEWKKILSFSTNKEMIKYLKLGRGKDKDITLIKMEYYDWAGNLTISKEFDEVGEVEGNLFKESEELNNS